MKTWINISEALPDDIDKNVLAAFANRSIETIHAQDILRCMAGDRCLYYSGEEITHWMELPVHPRLEIDLSTIS